MFWVGKSHICNYFAKCKSEPSSPSLNLRRARIHIYVFLANRYFVEKFLFGKNSTNFKLNTNEGLSTFCVYDISGKQMSKDIPVSRSIRFIVFPGVNL